MTLPSILHRVRSAFYCPLSTHSSLAAGASFHYRMPIQFRHELPFYFLTESRIQELYFSFLFLCKLLLRRDDKRRRAEDSHQGSRNRTDEILISQRLNSPASRTNCEPVMKRARSEAFIRIDSKSHVEDVGRQSSGIPHPGKMNAAAGDDT
jgi:hypothetical protein